MTVCDYLTGNITDKYGCHHWTWFATNGKSAQENYMIQRWEIYNKIEAQREEQKALRDENDVSDVNINIKTVVK